MDLDSIRKDMTPVAELEYGKTPWDSLDKEQLLYLVQSYHSMAQKLHGMFRVFPDLKRDAPPRWKREFDRVETAANYVFSAWDAELQAAADAMDTEVAWGGTETDTHPEEGDQFFRNVMRPARHLLAFDHHDAGDLFPNWKLCPRCGLMLGVGPTEGMPFPNCKSGTEEAPCRDQFRPFTWEDYRHPQEPS